MGLHKGQTNSGSFKKGESSWNKGKELFDMRGINAAHWKGGKLDCIDCGKKLSNRVAKRCRSCAGRSQSIGKREILRQKGILNGKKNGLKGLIKQQNSKEPTSIEKAVYDFLVLKGIIFEKQKLINGKFLVDAYIPSLNMVIECDGKYWHSLPRVVNKDKAENAYLKTCGFKMTRLSEDEINSGSFRERLVI